MIILCVGTVTTVKQEQNKKKMKQKKEGRKKEINRDEQVQYVFSPR